MVAINETLIKKISDSDLHNTWEKSTETGVASYEGVSFSQGALADEINERRGLPTLKESLRVTRRTAGIGRVGQLNSIRITGYGIDFDQSSLNPRNSRRR